MKYLLSLFVYSLSVAVPAADTLRFHSNAFGAERYVVVHTPTFFPAASEQVRMPVFILLDGQHEWFVQPLLSDIHFLQYTHEVPQAITVVVPHGDRVKESAERGDEQDVLPLLRMLTEELPPLLTRYHPGDYTVLIGHSFTASFALYAKLRAPEAFDAVIALSPLHRVEHYLPELAKQLVARPNDDLLVAVGGSDGSKDGGHYEPLIAAWNLLPCDRKRAQMRLYPSAGHTSLPIIAFPELLSNLFMDFALRDSLAPVDDEYQLRSAPGTPSELMARVQAGLRFRGTELPWEIAEINGLASRVEASGYSDHARAIYQRGVELYPGDASMNWFLGELMLSIDRAVASHHLRKALELIEREPVPEAEKEEARAAIKTLLE